MRILVTGPREWDNPELIAKAFSSLARPDEWAPGEVILVHGKARGWDKLCEAEGYRRRWDVRGYEADWHPEKYGRTDMLAGFRRNQEMVNAGADWCIAGIMPCGKQSCHLPRPHPTHGTMDCVGRAMLAGIKVIPVLYDVRV